FQVIFSLLTFSFDCESLRNKNLIINVGFSFLICTVLVVFFPTIGPVYYWGYDYRKEIAGSYISDVILLQEGYSKIFYFNKMEGVYDFPSFHAVLGILFIYAHRGLKTFYPFLILNVIMIVAAIPVGGHYLSDILAGIAVAGFTILLTKALEQNKRTKAAKANHTP
ncbi:phosphatase PAP2 family protein, partial [Acetobacter orientalis]